MEHTTDPGAKVAIPRLKRAEQPLAPPKPVRVRPETVNKACTRCRRRKTKCSAHRPSCHNCVKNGDECVYEQPRRDRLRDALIKSEMLMNLLKDLRIDVDGEHAQRIDETLHQFEDDTPPPTPSRSIKSIEKRPRAPSDDSEHDANPTLDETHVSASVGSNEDLDFLDKDLLEREPSDKTGFLGRNSQVQWMRTLQRKLNEPEIEPSNMPYAPPGDGPEAIDKRAHALHQREQHSAPARPLQEFYFYLDNETLEPVDNVDPDAMPPIETAERLYTFYQEAVHTPFRILDDQYFGQLKTYYAMIEQGSAFNVTSKWKAIMNLVFAIGARFSHVIGAPWQADDHDHIVYMSRATYFLELTKFTAIITTPDLAMIQATGLLSFYYLAVGHVSRAWFLIGIALRHAQAVGFHLRNEDANIPLEKKRVRSQTWWALHSIECILTSITGRPRVVYQNDCTVPLLTSLTDGNSSKKRVTSTASKPKSRRTPPSHSMTTSGAYTQPGHTEHALQLDQFLHYWTDLDVLQHRVFSTLYSAGTAVKSWQYMEEQISSFISELDAWAVEALPSEAFGSPADTGPSQQREKLLLQLYLQSIRICITRPCLCRLDRRMPDQSDESSRFNRSTAEACVQAAMDVASCLPEPTDAQWLYTKGPWWTPVHILMQALTVLLLELAQGTSQLSEDPYDISTCVEKLTQWLSIMKTVDGVAERAYIIVSEMLSKNHQFARKMVSSPWLDEITQSGQAGPATFTNVGYQSQIDPALQDFTNDMFSSGSGTPTQDDSLIMNDLSASFANPFESFQFGQPQYPMFYGNEFTPFFDQNMGYGFPDGDEMLEDWNNQQQR